MSYSSDKKHKLIFENWRRFLKEEVEPGKQTYSKEDVVAGGVSADKLISMPLQSFISVLNTNKKDVINSIVGGLKDANVKDDQVKIQEKTVPIAKLRPTQSEVVFSKSIPFAIQRPKLFMQQLTSNGPFKVGPPNNNAIVTLNGKYILDGHHRWSSLFCVNPKASIHTFDLQIPVSPQNALKLMQASIKAYVPNQKIPSNKGGGVNLFTIDQGMLENQIKELVTPDIADQYIQLGFIKGADRSGKGNQQQEVVQRLVGIYKRNVAQMQANNKPVSGATSREAMPQTDAPAGSNVKSGAGTPAALEPLEKGMIDFRPPFSANTKK